MVAVIIRRLVQSFVVMFVVALVAFTLFQFVGDPINQLVGVETGLKEREELRQRLGLNDPWIVQFGRFALNAVQFDFGISYQHKRPVIDMIMTRMPATLELSLISALFS